MACRTGCLTKDHASWGECLRAANMKIAYCGIGGGDATGQKKWQAEINEYRAAAAQGIRPVTTKTRDIRAAVEQSNKTGVAFDGSK